MSWFFGLVSAMGLGRGSLPRRELGRGLTDWHQLHNLEVAHQPQPRCAKRTERIAHHARYARMRQGGGIDLDHHHGHLARFVRASVASFRTIEVSPLFDWYADAHNVNRSGLARLQDAIEHGMKEGRAAGLESGRAW
jgi:hypothetical protein